MQEALANARSTAIVGATDRTVWTDFSAQMGKLEWNKLTQLNGVNLLATDLKTHVEADLPELTKYDVNEYEAIIKGYINLQGAYDKNQGEINKTIGDELSLINLSVDLWDRKNINTYLTKSNRIENETDLNWLVSKSYDYSYDSYNNSLITVENDKYKNNMLQNILTLSYIAKDTDTILFNNKKRYNYRYPNNFTFRDLYNPSIKENSIVNDYFYGAYNNQSTITTMFAHSSENNMNYIRKDDIDSVKSWYSSFNDFYNKIDWEADQSKWMIDKENYRNQIAPVKAFADKIKEYTDAYDAMMADRTDSEKQVKVINLYNEISRIKDNPENYYDNIKPILTEDTKNLFKAKSEEVVRDLQSYADRMKVYDQSSTVVADVITKSKKYKDAINDAQKAVDDKNKEIADLTNSINNISITDEEREVLSPEKQKELNDKMDEEKQLLKVSEAKVDEVDRIDDEIKKLSFFNIGKETVAIGSKSFVSGERGMVIGQENTSLANHSVVIGQNNTLDVNAANTFVLGSNVTANVPNSVVLGNNSSVSNPIGTEKITIRNVEYGFAGTQPVGTVSVGANNKERTITNVAAGRIDDTSTDAVNGSQLHSVIKAVNDLASPAPQANAQPVEFRSGADGKIAIAKTTENGKQIYTFNWNGGSASVAEAGVTTAIGSDDNTLVIKNTGEANNRNYNIEVNKNLNLTQNGSLTIGNSKLSNAGLTVGNNKLDTDGLNIGNKIVIKNNAVKLGNNILDGVGDGEISATSKQAINGSQLYRIVSNVQSVLNHTDVQQLPNINNHINNIDGRLSNVENRLEKQNSMRKAGHASALAAAGLMQAYAPGQSSATAAIGQFQGQSAVAVGFSTLSDDGKFGVKGSIVTNTQNEVGGNSGVGYFW